MSSATRSKPRRHAVFFDRDGVLNVDYGYVFEPSRLQWRPTAIEAIQRLNARNVLTFVVTNQSGVARGMFGEEDVRAFHDHMQEALARAGARIDAFRYCPHHPEGKIARFRKTCDCRKPAGGMIRDLLAEYDLDPRECHLFGDKASDLEAAASQNVVATLVKDEDYLLHLVQRWEDACVWPA